MEYLRFPFGKYKGVAIEDLPTTYIALALESFDLPDELSEQLFKTLLGRLNVYSKILHEFENYSPKSFAITMQLLISEFEKEVSND